jgi:hypothetical protein
MGDRENTGQQQQQSQTQASTPLPPATTPPAPNPDQPHANGLQYHPDANPDNSHPWFKNPDWHMVWITVLLFAVGVYTALVFHRQFKEMQKQTKILNDQAQQAATDSIDSAKRVEKQLGISDKQAKAARQNVAAIQQQMREDQRAWLKLEMISSDYSNVVGAIPSAMMRVTNVGKTAALKVRIGILIELVPDGTTPRFIVPGKQDRPLSLALIGSIFPGDKHDFKVIFNHPRGLLPEPSGLPQPITPWMHGQLQGGKDYTLSYLATHGVAFYDDIFGIGHWTHFCSWWADPSVKEMHAAYCSDYNGVDNN